MLKTESATCPTCEQRFEAPAVEVARGRGKFCSRLCMRRAASRMATAPVYGCLKCRKVLPRGVIKNHEIACAKGRNCPVCGEWFYSRGRATCSYACANTFFRSGTNHGNWKPHCYRTTCFSFHVRACVVCGENKILDVHHLDGDHENNTPENLIPLCPTHHQYWHSRYRRLVEPKIREYLVRWKEQCARSEGDQLRGNGKPLECVGS